MRDAVRSLHEDHPLHAAGYVQAADSSESGGAPAEPLIRVTDRERKRALTGVAFGVVAITLDLTIITVALPQIRADLGGDIETIQWVASLYSLSYAVFLIPSGRLVDLVGPRRMMFVGSLIYAAASLLAGLAPDDAVLIVARVPQGLGASMVAPASAALVAHLYDEGRRGAVIGLLGGLLGVASGIAPLIGGVLTDAVTWRAIFLVNVPTIAVALLLLRRLPREIDGDRHGPLDLDLGGTALFGASVLGVNLALIESGRLGFWPWGVAMLALAALAGVGLWRHDRRRTAPILDIGLLRDRVIAGSLVAKVLVGFAYYGGLLYLTLFLQGTLGMSAAAAGAVLLPSAAAGIFISPWVGKRVEGRHPRPFMMLGLGLTAFAMLLLTLLDAESSVFWHLLPGMVVVGIGTAVVSVSGRVAPTDRVEPERQGSVNGLISTAGKLASGFGVSFAALVFHARAAERAQEAIDADRAVGVGLQDVVDALAVNDLRGHLHDRFPALGDGDLAGIVQVVEDTFLHTLGDVLLALGALTAIGAAAVWWLLGDARATTDRQDSPTGPQQG